MPGEFIFGRGTLCMWDDEKGFGFIEPQEGGADVFVHITAFGDRSIQPAVGALIIYRRITDEQRRPRAIKARLESAAPESGPTFAPLAKGEIEVLAPRRVVQRRRPERSGGWSEPKVKAGWGVAIFLGLLAGVAAFGFVSAWVPALYAVMSSVTFTAYYADQNRAKNQEWRIAENTLHLLELLGGWPGALLAQQWLRHKTAKVSYQVIFWLIVAAHVVLWAWFALRQTGGL